MNQNFLSIAKKFSSSASPPQTITSSMMPLSSTTIEQDFDPHHHDLVASSTVVDDPPGGAIGVGDAASLVTESSSSSSSEAVVSLFNCWSSIEEASPFVNGGATKERNDDDSGSPLAGWTVSVVPTTSSSISPEEVLRRLTKRLRPDDMPTIPRGRKRPTCCFINYLGGNNNSSAQFPPPRDQQYHHHNDDYARAGGPMSSMTTTTTETWRPAAMTTNAANAVATTITPLGVAAAAIMATRPPTRSAARAVVPHFQPQHDPQQPVAAPPPPRTIVTNGKKCSWDTNFIGHDQKEDHLSFASLGGEGTGFPLGKSPDLGASFSPADVELEELDLLGPLFADDDMDVDDDAMLFPTSMLSMSKVSFLPLIMMGSSDDGLGDCDHDDVMQDDGLLDLPVMVRSLS